MDQSASFAKEGKKIRELKIERPFPKNCDRLPCPDPFKPRPTFASKQDCGDGTLDATSGRSWRWRRRV